MAAIAALAPIWLHDGGLAPIEIAVVVGHLVLFLATLRIAVTSYRAYRRSGEALHRNLAAAFLFLLIGLSLDDFLREVGPLGRIGSEVAELAPALLAIGLIYYALFLQG